MTRPSPEVAVIVPAFNAARWLREALQSVQAQTFANWELVVVDDGSTDATAEIAAGFARRDPRIGFLRQANRGVAAARNAGIAATTAPLIAPLDADDFWFPEKLELQVEALGHAGPEAGLAYAWSANVDPDSRLTGGLISSREEGDGFGALFLGNYVGNASAPLMRRSVIDTVGGYDTEFFARGIQGCEDRELYLRIAERYRIVLVPRVLVAYRLTPGSMSSSHHRMLRSHRFAFRKLRRRRPDLPAELFGWADVFYDFYLERGAARAGQPFAALGLLARAAIRLPRVLVSRDFWRLVRVRSIAAARLLAGVPRAPPPAAAVGITRDELERRARERQGPAGGVAALKHARITAARRLARRGAPTP